MTPNNGKSIKGRNEVTGMGAASVTHHVIIQAAIAITLKAPGEIKFSGSKTHNSTNSTGPRKKPNKRAGGNEFTIAIVVFPKLLYLNACANILCIRCLRPSSNVSLFPFKFFTRDLK
jgi:hypothetical protein